MISTLQPVTALAKSCWPRTWTGRHKQHAQASNETITNVRQRASQFRELSPDELRGSSDALRELQQQTELTSAQVLTTGFALVNEAVRRTVGFEYYDVQLQAGFTLAQCTIAEMQTGEGKTLVGALPAFIFALAGRGVHVMTSNAYLAERDCELLAPVFQVLGMTAGVTKPNMDPAEKRDAYARDVTYGPGYEFGFDYLRDQAALLDRPQLTLGQQHRKLMRGEEIVQLQTIQRGHAFAIVDEIDSVLLDEATSPLILSGGMQTLADNPEVYIEARHIADQLASDVDYLIDNMSRAVRLTSSGATKAMEYIQQQTAVRSLQRPWTTYVEHALRAALLFKRDVHYVVDDDNILLVDESTGRIFADRTLRDGLHQALEAKEQVPIHAEQEPLARISRQRYCRLYDGICGMTGTATGNEKEFRHFYRLPVHRIPLRRPSQRTALPARFFANADAKWTAIAADIRRIHGTSQPILVGARTIENSMTIAARLDAMDIPYQLLNGRQDAEEAEIVAQAGYLGAITIATNMAGRGTDIKLRPGVSELGGLHVIVSELHLAARVDRQLVGRCGRQGDPGSYQMYVSAEDELVVQFAPDVARRIKRLADQHGEARCTATDALDKAQRAAEREAFLKRRQLFAHDDWLDEVLASLVKET